MSPAPEIGLSTVTRPWTAFWRTLTRFETGKIVPEIAVRNTVGFLTAFTIATTLVSPRAGVLAGIGALNVSYSDSRDPYLLRTRRMTLSSLLCGLAVTLGALSGHSDPMAVVAATLWAFGAGMLVALGSTAGDLGVITLVTIVVFAATPLSPADALLSGATAFGGGLMQTLFANALWPVRRYVPERSIVASLYGALAGMAKAPGLPSAAPPLTGEISRAAEALTSLNRDHSGEAERLVFLLNQAERIRLSLLTLGRIARRLGKDENGREASECLMAALRAASLTLDSIRNGALEGRPAAGTTGFAAAVRAFHLSCGRTGPFSRPRASLFFGALLRDAGLQLDALGGQLRAASGVASPPAARRGAEEPWRLRFSGWRARLEANLSLHSTVFRHALRLAVCLGAGDALGRALSLHRTYWIPMTIAIVLKPDFTTTVSRGVLRIAGTFAGLVVATVLFHFLHNGIGTDIALMTVFVFLLRCVGPANYGIFVTALSAMIVLLIATTGVAPRDVIVARAVNTAVGGALAMIAYGLWPTWERTQVGPALADMIDAYREYFHAVMAAFAGGSAAAIDRARVKGRRARSNAEASVDRMGGEPRIAARELSALNAILVNSHSFAHALMAMEAGLYQTGKAPPRDATMAFGRQVENMLGAISETLRTRAPLPRGLPDLRAAHNAIIDSHEAITDRYALVNVETDRIVTSLDTLREQVGAAFQGVR